MFGQGELRGGITSACAEQTGGRCPGSFRSGDHLRVCGADLLVILLSMGDRGSPPRVRSRQLMRVRLLPCYGITSACAEQTHMLPSSKVIIRDHLRVCGAD